MLQQQSSSLTSRPYTRAKRSLIASPILARSFVFRQLIEVSHPRGSRSLRVYTRSGRSHVNWRAQRRQQRRVVEATTVRHDRLAYNETFADVYSTLSLAN